MTTWGSCPCGAVGFTVDGPVRDVIVCHCGECRSATGGPWAATAAHRSDLRVENENALIWDRAAVSEHDASRGRCRTCRTVVFWDAPGRETVSFAVALIDGGDMLSVAAHIWVPEVEREELLRRGYPVEPRGLSDSAGVGWHDATPPGG